MITKKEIAEAIDSGHYETKNGKEYIAEFFDLQKATEAVWELLSQHSANTLVSGNEALRVALIDFIIYYESSTEDPLEKEGAEAIVDRYLKSINDR